MVAGKMKKNKMKRKKKSMNIGKDEKISFIF